MQTIPLFNGALWQILNSGEPVPAAGGLRAFLMTRNFAFYENFDFVVFGGQGAGPPDIPVSDVGMLSIRNIINITTTRG